MVAAGVAGGGAVASGSAAAATPAAAPAAVPATSFYPLSVTFVSLKTGWALGTSPCASGACLGLRETSDAGSSWVVRPLPAALLAAADRSVSGNPALNECCGGGLNVRFANLLDGWIYGGLLVPSQDQGNSQPVVWSTHNGGATWVQDRLPAGLNTTGTIFDLEVSGGRVYLMAPDKTFGVSVESSPLSRDSWQRATTGGPPAAPSWSAAIGSAGCRRVLRSATVLQSRQLRRPMTSSQYA
jgi:hypothetical protein